MGSLSKIADRLSALEYFIERHGYVIENALQTHIERMEEAENDCKASGFAGMARAFRESADRSREAIKALEALSEEEDDSV